MKARSASEAQYLIYYHRRMREKLGNSNRKHARRAARRAELLTIANARDRTSLPASESFVHYVPIDKWDAVVESRCLKMSNPHGTRWALWYAHPALRRARAPPFDCTVGSARLCYSVLCVVPGGALH